MRVPFYFDYSCPWAYLASCRVESYLADVGVEVDFRPVSLGVIREPATDPLPEGVKSPGLGPRKQDNMLNDLRHWAEFCGGEVSKAAREHRPNSRLLLQAALVAKDAGRMREFHPRAYRARWAEGRDIADPEVVGSLLAAAGLEPSAIERASSETLSERLDSESQEAMERGVFGVPTLFVGDEMFWGNDRLELARFYVQKSSAQES